MNNFISIITVTYNGLKYLKEFLDSTLTLNYPSDKYEVVVVDNGSKDGSIEFVRKNYPSVKLIDVGENLGFGKGNNLGMKKSRGDLYYLVNNDTSLEKDCLKNINSCFNLWSKKMKIGAIASKLILYDKYLPLTIEEAFSAGIKVENNGSTYHKESYKLTYDSGLTYLEEIYLPLSYDLKQDIILDMDLRRVRKKNYLIRIGEEVILKETLGNKNNEKIRIPLRNDEVKNLWVDLVQNAGNLLFRDGFGRDRGAIVIRQEQYYEPDGERFNKVETIPAFCGGGVLLNKKALEKVGYFDDNFFMYYEDDDLSLRMKKAGWEIIFCPKARIRHIHAVSSKEWSDFFIYHTERNRLLLVFKHWPRIYCLKEWLKYIFHDLLAVPLYYLIHHKNNLALRRFKTRLKVNFSLLPLFLINMFRGNRLTRKDLESFL